MSNFIQDLILNDEDYKWSYSRISKYDDCKYAWYLKYIEEIKTEELFFSQFVKFVHEIYASILLGNLSSENAVDYFLTNFRKEVTAKAPSDKVFSSYFASGLNAMKEVNGFLEEVKDYEILGVETPVKFKLGCNNFVGIIDLLLKDQSGNLIVVDHKSRTLKPRSKKRNLKSDAELDKYFKQLYLYSIAVKEMYGEFPTELWLHCYRNTDNKIIKEDFYRLKEKSDPFYWMFFEQEFSDKIKQIKATEEWTPNYDWFSCTNLCECHNECEYYQMMNR